VLAPILDSTQVRQPVWIRLGADCAGRNSAAFMPAEMDNGWKQVWSEMTDAELEGQLVAYLWLALIAVRPVPQAEKNAP
jgi:hypothetical protein